MTLTACSGGEKSQEGQKTTAVVVGDVKISKVEYGKNITKDFKLEKPGSVFAPADTIYTMVIVDGRPKSGKVTAKYYLEGEYLTEATYDLADVNSGVIISIGEATYMSFYLTHEKPLPVSKEYKIELYLNDQKAGDFPFEVAQ